MNATTDTVAPPHRETGAGADPRDLLWASPACPPQFSAAGPGSAHNASDSPRIGSLCTGYGGLDSAVLEVFGGSVAWHCQFDPEDRYQYAARILAHHWPEIPNHGDITTIDWSTVEPVHILTAGFPCQSLSLAGKREGIAEGTKSGLWLHVVRAIEALQPEVVVIENVPGLLSQKADRGLGPDAPHMDPATGARLVLRALGAVLGDLASLGFDAEWAVVRAEEVGAPHVRARVFLVAVRASAHADDNGAQRTGQAGRLTQRHAPGQDRQPADTARPGRPGTWLRRLAALQGDAAEDTDGTTRGERRLAAPGQEEGGRARADARRRGRTPAAGRGGSPADTADAHGEAVRHQPVGQPRRGGTAIPEQPRPEAAPHAAGRRREGHQERDSEPRTGQQAHRQLDADGRGLRGEAAEPVCPTCGCGEHAHDAGGFCAGCGHCTDPGLGRPDCYDDGYPVCATGPEAVPAAADAEGDRRHEGQPQPARDTRGPDPGERRRTDTADADRRGRRADEPGVRQGQPDLVWGDYEPAIRRWEAVTGRRAPRPTDDRGRLSPEFVEWMMGLPAGHVTGVPGLPRSAQLKALGNGVVPQQAAAALRLLWARFWGLAA